MSSGSESCVQDDDSLILGIHMQRLCHFCGQTTDDYKVHRQSHLVFHVLVVGAKGVGKRLLTRALGASAYSLEDGHLKGGPISVDSKTGAFFVYTTETSEEVTNELYIYDKLIYVYKSGFSTDVNEKTKQFYSTLRTFTPSIDVILGEELTGSKKNGYLSGTTLHLNLTTFEGRNFAKRELFNHISTDSSTFLAKRQ